MFTQQKPCCRYCRSMQQIMNNKSIWSRVSTSLYLCYHNRGQYKENMCQNKRSIGFVLLGILCIVYLYISYFMEIDVAYWINHSIKYHESHFKWSTSLNGEFCDNKPLMEHKGRDLWKLSQNNVNFENTRSRVLLLSFPRSGNHLTRAMIECLLQTATYGYTKDTHTVYIPRKIEDQKIALQQATVKDPFIRKIHTPQAIPSEFMQYAEDGVGLIYLIRDPIECILSENKYVPYFWKDYEYQFGFNFLRSPEFFNQWNEDSSKLLLFYEDYYNQTTQHVNLKRLAEYFGEERVSKEQLEYCMDNYDDIIHIGLGALQRKSTSNKNLHFYRDKYFSKDQDNWPQLKVSEELYENIFYRYENIEPC